MTTGRVFRSATARAKGAGAWLTGWVALALSKIERGNTIVLSKSGDGAPRTLGPRVAVFCHFDAQGCVRDHTRAYIDALRKEGLDLVFVSNSAWLAPADLAWVSGRAARIVLRRNVGYDFAAWRDAMMAYDLPASGTELLLLANDSVYGPLRPLGPVLDRLDFGRADVWGATDSWQRRFHLQSYFVAFGPRALASQAFKDFWAGVGNIRSKGVVVSRYEVGLTRAFIAAGFRCRALWSYAEIIEAMRDASRLDGHEGASEANRVRNDDPFTLATSRNVQRVLEAALKRAPVNPTADLWLTLLNQGFPFLKRELLRHNPSQISDVAVWPYAVDGMNAGERDMILRDLERVAKNRSP